MADISIDFGLLEDNREFAIVCNGKFEVVHCLRAIDKKYPSVLPMTPNRYCKIVLGFMRPVAIALHLNEGKLRVGYDDPDYYSRNGYVVVNFRDAVIENELQESDASLAEFLGVL